MARKQAEKIVPHEPGHRRYSRQWLTFMEFVHRQEEASTSPRQKHRPKRKEQASATYLLFELCELLFVGVLIFAFMTLLLLIMN